MKFLTIRQPWASLIAVGAKTIETRPFSTTYRGPLAIHAGKAEPVAGAAGYPFHDGLGDLMWMLERPWTEEEQVAQGLLADGDLCGFRLPLGAVVAVCDLIDVVPIVSWLPLDGPPAWAAHMIPTSGSGADRMLLVRDAHIAAEVLRVDGPLPADIDVTGQLPFGDFTPGRFAWLFGNVRLIDPVPMKGAQGLRDLPDDIVPRPHRRRQGVSHNPPLSTDPIIAAAVRLITQPWRGEAACRGNLWIGRL